MAAHLNRRETDPVATSEISALQAELAERGLPLPVGDEGQVPTVVDGEIVWSAASEGFDTTLDYELHGKWIYLGDVLIKGPGSPDPTHVKIAVSHGKLLVLSETDDAAELDALYLNTADGSQLGRGRLHIHSGEGKASFIDIGDEPRVTLTTNDDGLLVITTGMSIDAELEDVDAAVLGRIRLADAQNANEAVTRGQVDADLATIYSIFESVAWQGDVVPIVGDTEVFGLKDFEGVWVSKFRLDASEVSMPGVTPIGGAYTVYVMTNTSGNPRTTQLMQADPGSVVVVVNSTASNAAINVQGYPSHGSSIAGGNIEGLGVGKAMMFITTDVDGKIFHPLEFLREHTHPISAITDLQAQLDGKSPTGHTHTQAQVANLVSDLAAKVDLTSAQSISGIKTVSTAMIFSGTQSNPSNGGQIRFGSSPATGAGLRRPSSGASLSFDAGGLQRANLSSAAMSFLVPALFSNGIRLKSIRMDDASGSYGILDSLAPTFQVLADLINVPEIWLPTENEVGAILSDLVFVFADRDGVISPGNGVPVRCGNGQIYGSIYGSLNGVYDGIVTLEDTHGVWLAFQNGDIAGSDGGAAFPMTNGRDWSIAKIGEMIPND